MTRLRCSLFSPSADQRPLLVGRPGDRALDLGDLDLRHHDPTPPWLRLRRSRDDRGCRRTLRPRLAAIRRGLTTCTSASKVALTMLCGLVEPSDLPTTSWMPSASHTARIGPPAMMPVPGGAVRSSTRPAPKWPIDVVVQRAALPQRHPDHAALGLLGRLAHRLRHLARLAAAVADPALAVADDHQRREAEPTAALHHLGDAVDAHQAVDQLAVLTILGAPCRDRLAVPWELLVLKLQAALAGALGQGLDPTMILVAAAIEHHRLDAGFLGALGQQQADPARRLAVGAGLQLGAQTLVQASRRPPGSPPARRRSPGRRCGDPNGTRTAAADPCRSP